MCYEYLKPFLHYHKNNYFYEIFLLLYKNLINFKYHKAEQNIVKLSLNILKHFF